MSGTVPGGQREEGHCALFVTGGAAVHQRSPRIQDRCPELSVRLVSAYFTMLNTIGRERSELPSRRRGVVGRMVRRLDAVIRYYHSKLIPTI